VDIKAVLTRTEPGSYEILLVNLTKRSFESVRVLSGAIQTIDDKLIESSKVYNDLGPMKPYSQFKISSTDDFELEMQVWFELDLYKNMNESPEMYSFAIPRRFDYDEDAIPTMPEGKKGIIIPLETRRDGQTINEWLEENSTEARITKSKGAHND